MGGRGDLWFGGGRLPYPRIAQQDQDPLKEKPTPLDLLIERILGWSSDVDRIRESQDGDSWRKGHHVDFLVGGANAAGRGLNGLSYLPFGAAITGDFKLYRHDQGDKLIRDLKEYLKNMKPGDPTPRVFGHSWGGSTVANIAKEFPNVQFNAIDPVSWFNRLSEYPANLRVFQPDEDSDTNEDWQNTAARVVGGAWPVLPESAGNTVRYKGGHVQGVEEAVNEALAADLRRENPVDPETSADVACNPFMPVTISDFFEQADNENRRLRVGTWKRENALKQIANETASPNS